MKTRNFVFLISFIVCSACQHATNKTATDTSNTSKMAIISINDVYRIAGIDNGQTGGLARVRALRKQIEAEYQHVLFLHAGDFLHPSFISKQDQGMAMIQVLNVMDGLPGQFDDNMIVTWGNHEFDKGRMKHVGLMNDLLELSEFSWLGSNINWQDNSLNSPKMIRHKLIEYGDFTIGLFSQSTGIAHPEYIKDFIDFKSTAEKYVPLLKQQGADFVIALTHQWLPDDEAMMQLADDIRPDLIIGGHEHYQQIIEINNNWILKADADAASAIVAEVSVNQGRFTVMPQVIALDAQFPEDVMVKSLTDELVLKNDTSYCLSRGLENDCLTEVLNTTSTKLMAEETEIRRYETNLGNTLADMVLDEFSSCDADVVLLNSGSIRLNQNIPAGAEITIKHLEEMFPYPSDLRLIEFDQALFQSILEHSISSWTANGHWLQVAGFVFVHDPLQHLVSHIHLKGQEVYAPDQVGSIRAVVPYYLISDETDHDGYTMINEAMQVTCDKNGTQLKSLFKSQLKASPTPLDVVRDYRICNTTRDTCQ